MFLFRSKAIIISSNLRKHRIIVIETEWPSNSDRFVLCLLESLFAPWVTLSRSLGHPFIIEKFVFYSKWHLQISLSVVPKYVSTYETVMWKKYVVCCFVLLFLVTPVLKKHCMPVKKAFVSARSSVIFQFIKKTSLKCLKGFSKNVVQAIII